MAKKETLIKLDKEQKEMIAEKLKEYLWENFDIEAGNLQTNMLCDFINDNIGIYFYNQAVADCMGFINKKTEDMYLLMKDE